ncbi:MOSC domain-containing protein [Blautia sp.]
MARILCVCISKERKTSSQNIHECEADLQGLVGDVHYGMGGRRQVTLLPYEKVKPYFDETGQPVRYGRFGENLLTEGLDWNVIEEGSRFRCGDVLLEVVRIGAGGPASDAYKGEKVCSPMEAWFIFCQIIEPGILKEGAEIVPIDK